MLNFVKEFVLNHGKRKKFFKSIKGEEKVLELGCGAKGTNAIYIKKIFPKIDYHGVDLLPEERIPSIIEYKVVDIQKHSIPYLEKSFDVIILTHVLEHLSSPLFLAKEINRLLRNGGRIYLETPNWTTMFVPSFGFHREQAHPFNFFDDITHIKPWTKHSIYTFLKRYCQLEVKKIGNTRNWIRIPFDPFIIILGLIKGNRSYIISSFWNIYGWSIYGIGVKK